jgi:hypothetical protein
MPDVSSATPKRRKSSPDYGAIHHWGLALNNIHCADQIDPHKLSEHGQSDYRASGDVRLLAALLRCGECIEIDQLWIVRIGIGVGPSAAMNVHKGLHTPGI